MPRPILSRLALAALLAVALLASTASAQAPVVLRPGHPDLMTSGLTLSDQLMVYRISEPSVRDLGTVAYAFERSGDTVTMVTTSDASSIGLSGAVTSEFSWPSLAPVRSQRSAKSRVDYDGAHMTGV